jgi:hypothetical protein
MPVQSAKEVIDRQIRSLVLCVDLVGSRRIWPAHVGCLVDLDGSRWVQSDRLDDQPDDQAGRNIPMSRAMRSPLKLAWLVTQVPARSAANSLAARAEQAAAAPGKCGDGADQQGRRCRRARSRPRRR